MFSELNSTKIAKISKIFGQNGELHIRLYDTFPDEIDKKEPMFVFLNGLLVPLFIKSFSRKGVNKAVAQFDDIDTLYRASELVGLEIVSFAEQVEEEKDLDEMTYNDFIGFTFNDNNSGREGEIVDFIDHDLNPLFVVEYEQNEYFIPSNDEIIVDYSIENRKINLSLPEGIFEIND